MCGFIKGSMAGGALVIGPLVKLAMAGLYLFAFNFVTAAELKYRQCLSVVLHAFVAVGLVHGPLMLLVFALKGDWNVSPETVLQASPAALLDMRETPRFLYSLAASL